MSTQQQTTGERGRWLRLAMLTYTLATPVIRIVLERVQKQAQSAANRAQQATLSERLGDLTEEGRERIAEQVERLRRSAQQLQKQSRELRKAASKEAKQRRKLLEELRKAGIDWGQDMLKRGEHLTEDLLERGSEASQELARRSEELAAAVAGRGSQITRDLAERGEELTHDLTKRTRKASRALAKRGRKVTHNLTERGEELLEPIRKQNRNFLAILGFSIGLLIAGFVTYRLVRARTERAQVEDDQSIELPLSSAVAQSARVRRADERQNGSAVATLENIETGAQPAGALFVGIANTKRYYPIDAQVEETDLVYFISEEEARAQGYTAAE